MRGASHWVINYHKKNTLLEDIFHITEFIEGSCCLFEVGFFTDVYMH